MKLSKNMQKELNKQVNAEMYSSYLYFAMSAHFETESLKGLSKWMSSQAQEEMSHALKIYNYIHERGGEIELEQIEKPDMKSKEINGIFEQVLEHEQLVTSLIHKLVDLANEEKDYATSSMLQWFVDEQVEEEANVEEILGKLKLINNNPGGIFMLDQELGKRVFVDETQNA